jgi:hypothetical protein
MQEDKQLSLEKTTSRTSNIATADLSFTKGDPIDQIIDVIDKHFESKLM